MKDHDCPLLRWPIYHSGYTGKSGEETWFFCNKYRKPIRHIKRCLVQGNVRAQGEEFVLYSRGGKR
jgi:hypothetical protein